MTKAEIIDQLAKNRVVEQIIINLSTTESKFNRDDLAQDVYIVLLGKDEELIQGLYERKELNFYIVRILKNQIFSVTSEYFKKYKQFDQKNDSDRLTEPDTDEEL